MKAASAFLHPSGDVVRVLMFVHATSQVRQSPTFMLLCRFVVLPWLSHSPPRMLLDISEHGTFDGNWTDSAYATRPRESRVESRKLMSLGGLLFSPLAWHNHSSPEPTISQELVRNVNDTRWFPFSVRFAEWLVLKPLYRDPTDGWGGIGGRFSRLHSLPSYLRWAKL